MRRTLEITSIIYLCVVWNTGCGSAEKVWPFPPHGPLTGERRLELVGRRVAAIRAVAALLQVTLESGKKSGSFEVAVVYERPARLRLVASRGMLLSSVPVFDLIIVPPRYHLTLYGEGEDGEPEVFSDSLHRFPGRHPDMAGLFWIREVLFLAGEGIGLQLSNVAAGSGGEPVRVRGRTSDGADVEYLLDDATSAVLSASLRIPASGKRFSIEYADYRATDDVYIPQRVEVHGDDGAFSLEAVVIDLEVNQPAEPGSLVFPDDSQESSP